MHSNQIRIDFTKSLSQRVIDFLGQIPEGRATSTEIAVAVSTRNNGSPVLPSVSKAIFNHQRRDTPKVRRCGSKIMPDGQAQFAYELTSEGWLHVGEPGHGAGIRKIRRGSHSHSRGILSANGTTRPQTQKAADQFQQYLHHLQRQARRAHSLEEALGALLARVKCTDPALFQRLVECRDTNFR